MKNGFSITLDSILKRFGMATRGIIGTVVGSKSTRETLRNLGYRVERGLQETNYDFVYLAKSQSSLYNILRALDKVDFGCLVIFRLDELMGLNLWNSFKQLGNFYVFEFEPNKLFGVILKGKR